MGLLDTYNKKAKKIQPIIDEIIELLQNDELKEIASGLKDAKKRFENQEFLLAVMGKQKRGKSSFVNVLMREDIMPTGAIPVSSALVKVSYASKKEMKVDFLNGSHEKHDVTKLAEFCTEKLNPGNKKGVEQVNINYPLEMIRGGVTLVDTPGEGAVHEGHSKIVYDFLPRADAIIFLFSSDSPIDKSELEFVKKVGEGAIRKIFFVQNKTDIQEQSEELESLVDFNLNVIRGIDYFKDFTLDNIYKISSKFARQDVQVSGNPREKTGFPQFENRLKDFLLNEKGAMQLCTYIDNASKSLERLKLKLSEDLKNKAKSIPELKNELNEIEEKSNEVKAKFDKKFEEFDQSLGPIKKDCHTELKDVKNEFEKKFLKQIDDIGVMDIGKLGDKKFFERLFQNHLIEPAVEVIDNLVNNNVTKEIKKLQKACLEVVNQFATDMEEIRTSKDVEKIDNGIALNALPGVVTALGGAGLGTAAWVSAASAGPSGFFAVMWAWLFGSPATPAWLILGPPVGAILTVVGLLVGIFLVMKKVDQAKRDAKNLFYERSDEIIKEMRANFGERLEELSRTYRKALNQELEKDLEPFTESKKKAIKEKEEKAKEIESQIKAKREKAIKIQETLGIHLNEMKDLIPEELRKSV